MLIDLDFDVVWLCQHVTEVHKKHYTPGSVIATDGTLLYIYIFLLTLF